MTDRELMQMALDALEEVQMAIYTTPWLNRRVEAIRARLAQPEPKPVAWFMEGVFMDGTPSFIQVCETDPEFYTPLYTAPPRREWQGLTDEETMPLVRRCADYYGYNDKPLHLTAGAGFWGLARAIEAKLREKNV